VFMICVCVWPDSPPLRLNIVTVDHQYINYTGGLHGINLRSEVVPMDSCAQLHSDNGKKLLQATYMPKLTMYQ